MSESIDTSKVYYVREIVVMTKFFDTNLNPDENLSSIHLKLIDSEKAIDRKEATKRADMPSITLRVPHSLAASFLQEYGAFQIRMSDLD